MPNLSMAEGGGGFVLRVRERFEATHHLRSYRGRPEPAHSHRWQVEVALVSERLDAEGMGVDFVEVTTALRELVEPFEGADINAVAPFDQLAPTTEHLARWFHQELERRLREARIVEVTVWEGPDCSATYLPAASSGTG
ncbi:MAG: 6-carboxytetrahydropterin synthase [bacterium]|nr:6-carboxytetrahydropterin synthase [bacterium]